MRLVRRRVFETNSSSTHSLTICTKDEFKKFEDGELFYYDERLISEDERKEMVKRRIIYNEAEFDFKARIITYKGKTIPYDEKEKELFSQENMNSITDEMINKYLEDEYDYDLPLTKEQYDDYNEELESYQEEYTTPNGEKIIVFGKYGYEG